MLQHRQNRKCGSPTTPSQVQKLASQPCMRYGQEMAESTCLSMCEKVHPNAKREDLAKTLSQNTLCSLSRRHPPKKQDQDWLQQPQHYACCTCPHCLSKCRQYLQDTLMHWSAQQTKQCLVRLSVDDWFCDTACCCTCSDASSCFAQPKRP